MSDLTTQDIELSLERDRMALARSLADLRSRFSAAALADEGKTALKAQAGPMLARVDAAVRRQPFAAALAGVALAALVFGRTRVAETGCEVPALAGTRFEALTRWEDEGGPPAPEPVDLSDEDWLHEAQGRRDRAQDLLARIDAAARRGLAPATELARHRAEVISALASDTARALGKGLESLSGAARDQALQARERVYLARVALAEKGRDTVERHPLACGAVLAAAGAAVASLFPPTEAEDRLLGETRDRVVSDLKATARSEAMKASELARTLTAALGRDLERVETALRPEHAWSGAGLRHH
jgi:hypothetical protein